MASQSDGDGGEVVTVETSNDRHSTVAISNQAGTTNDRFDKFTLFPRLPIELRYMVWEFAVTGRRFVYLHSHSCSIKHRKGRKFMIQGIKYQQVPKFFFVDRDSRYIALKYYTIRFQVAQQYRDRTGATVKRIDANLIMSPDDILVAWHSWELARNNRGRFSIEFGRQASLVRNLMVYPWDVFKDEIDAMRNMEMLRTLRGLIRHLGNKDAMEKAFLFYTGAAPKSSQCHRCKYVRYPINIDNLERCYFLWRFLNVELREKTREKNQHIDNQLTEI